MKIILKTLFSALLFSLLLAACGKDKEVLIDSSQPDGTFSAARTGTLTAESGTPTAGTLEVGTDSEGSNFLHFGSDFKTELGTGTVTVYFSKSATFMADPGNGNPNLKLVGIISKNGDQYMKLASPPGSDFTHVILWCGTASVPFGNAKLN